MVDESVSLAWCSTYGSLVSSFDDTLFVASHYVFKGPLVCPDVRLRSH